ncbi:MAG: hypothetical protein ACUVWX_03730 [Kiritimatiellia bacterium]
MNRHHYHPVWIIGLGILLLWIACGWTHASSVSLAIAPSTEFRDGRILVHVRVTNSGPETAHSPWIEARLGSEVVRRDLAPLLQPGDAFSTTLELEQPPVPPGIHTVLLVAHYDDTKGYPYTALTAIPVVTAEPLSCFPAVKVQLAPLVLSSKGLLRVKLTNCCTQALRVNLSLLLPEELRSVGEAGRIVLLLPHQTQDIGFEIENRWAIPPSSYTVVATANCTLDARHESSVGFGRVVVRQPCLLPVLPPRWGNALLILCLAGYLLALKAKRPLHTPSTRLQLAGEIVILVALFVFLLLHFPLGELFGNTLTVGGDTPAHHYLASHLKETLARGRIISWAGGWWCGFPMFLFYFCLPYLLMALLALIVPHAIAFKLVSLLGIMGLPPAAYGAGRLMRLPRPVPILLAVATIPLLFDNSHTMWGVNIYSTLAGMIANSVSFPVMLLALASLLRDTEDGMVRLRTVFLLVAMLASHFFTSLIAAMSLAILPLWVTRKRLRRALLTVCAECGLFLLLMAWWLVPLLAKREYAVDFGQNWNVSLLRSLPHFVLCTLPLTGFALFCLFRHTGCSLLRRFIVLNLWTLTAAVMLFLFGRRLSPVFVNVRLWPFVVYSLLALAAGGLGFLLRSTKGRGFAVCAAVIATLTYGVGNPERVYAWAKWNYSGLEKKPRWQVFAELVLPLRETPGRLANDLHEYNSSLGSTRIFECVPHVIGKPILEGGIVNSAAGALFAYYIQSETSETCAGFPPMVKPTVLNITNATRHLELFNVKYFIARGARTKEAFGRSAEWRLQKECQGWALYELTTHEGQYVFVPKRAPLAVKTTQWKEAALQWLYTIETVDQPFIFRRPKDPAPPEGTPVLNEAEYAACLNQLRRRGRTAELPVLARTDVTITNITVTDRHIAFDTTGVGLPHIIKCTYYPNWKLRDGGPVFMVSPCFMLVYPTSSHVELYYGSTRADNVGRALTLLGIAATLTVAAERLRKGVLVHAT